MKSLEEVGQDYGKTAPKSICTCGHTGDGVNSEHATVFAAGHGQCHVSGCDCPKFSWAYYREAFMKVLKAAQS